MSMSDVGKKMAGSPFWGCREMVNGKNTGIIKIIFDFTSTYVCTVPPRSHHVQTPLTPLAQVPFSRESRRPPRRCRHQHPPNHRQTSIDHGISARRRLAPQRQSSLRIAGRSLEEYITAPPTLSASKRFGGDVFVI
jgi:hypothetical protein